MENQNIAGERNYKMPQVSIRESEKDILLNAEMPGLVK